MSSSPEKSVSYVINKPVSRYMDEDVLVLDGQTRLSVASRIMQRLEQDDIIVTDDRGDPVGIVTDEDILKKIGEVYVNPDRTSLQEIMTSPLITIQQNESLKDALTKMRDQKVRKLPVVSKEGKIAGIILQSALATVLRNASATEPRFLSTTMKAVLGNLGFVLQFAGVLIIIPAIASTVLAEPITASSIYLTSVVLLVAGFFLNSYGEKSKLNLRSASMLVFSSLFILTLVGTIPYLYLNPYEINDGVEMFANSFFSSAVGFTTGGISLFDKPEELPQSFTFYRSFTQLIGGMSFIYLVMTAFYPEGKLRAMRGFISGRTLHLRELFSTITVIFGIYIAIVASLLYVFGEKNIVDNFSIAMSTLATGGFVPNSQIMQDLVWQEHFVLFGAMILGALPFTFHYAFVRKRFLSPRLGTEVIIFFGIMWVGIVLFTFFSGIGLLDGSFAAVAASTTAGLPHHDLSLVGGTAKSVLIVLMLVGGCGFSTAGGIKVFRLMQLRNLRHILKKENSKTISPQDKKEFVSSVIVISLFPLIAVFIAAHFGSMGYSFEDSFLDATGVITTGGIDTGIINMDTDPATKIALGMLMIIGRLEIIALVYIIVPRLVP